MGYTPGEWKLTEQEIIEVEKRGGFVSEAQEAKRKAYIEAGGIILNPEALEDMYKWIKDFGLHVSVGYDEENKPFYYIDADYMEMRKNILTKAEGGL